MPTNQKDLTMRFSKAFTAIITGLLTFGCVFPYCSAYAGRKKHIKSSDSASTVTQLDLMQLTVRLQKESHEFQQLMEAAHHGDLQEILKLEAAGVSLFGGTQAKKPTNELGGFETTREDAGQQEFDSLNGYLQQLIDYANGGPEPGTRLSNDSGKTQSNSPDLKDFGLGTASNNWMDPDTGDYVWHEEDGSVSTRVTVESDDGTVVYETRVTPDGGVEGTIEVWDTDNMTYTHVRHKNGEYEIDRPVPFENGSQPNPNANGLPLLFFWEYEARRNVRTNPDDVVSQPADDETDTAEDVAPTLGLAIVINPGDGSWRVERVGGPTGKPLMQFMPDPVPAPHRKR